MLDNPLISVIIPIYNAQLYLKDCIVSLLNQNYINIEIILVDDKSSDESLRICRKYEGIDKRVIVIEKENGGSTSARKAGLRRAGGKYICFVDADDWVDKDMLESMVAVAEKNDSDIVTSGFIREVECEKEWQYDGLEAGVYKGEQLHNEILPVIFYQGILKGWGIWPTLWGKLYKKEIIMDSIMELDERIYYGEDTAGLFPACFMAKCICVLKQAWYHYRVIETSVSRVRESRILNNMFYLHEYLHEKFSQTKYSDILKEQLRYYMLNLMNHAGKLLFDIPYHLEEPQWLREQLKHQPEKMIWVFPSYRLTEGSSIILYGSGKVGQSFHKQIIGNQFCTLVAWSDKEYEKQGDLINPKKINCLEFDYVVIAVSKEETAQEIRRELLDFGIPESKIFWEKPIVIKN